MLIPNSANSSENRRVLARGGFYEKADSAPIEAAAGVLRDRALNEPKQAHYVFYSTDINPENEERNNLVREITQRVTGMPCRFGADISERNDIYRVIIDQIKNAFVMVAHLTGMRSNILIEAGIAIGADVHIFSFKVGRHIVRPSCSAVRKSTNIAMAPN